MIKHFFNWLKSLITKWLFSKNQNWINKRIKDVVVFLILGIATLLSLVLMKLGLFCWSLHIRFTILSHKILSLIKAFRVKCEIITKSYVIPDLKVICYSSKDIV